MLTAWRLGLQTSNSCQAWGQWDVAGTPCPQRVDLLTVDDAEHLAAELGLADFCIRITPWGHAALTWFAGGVNDRRSPD